MSEPREVPDYDDMESTFYYLEGESDADYRPE